MFYEEEKDKREGVEWEEEEGERERVNSPNAFSAKLFCLL